MEKRLENQIIRAVERIQSSGSILITSCESPDGDSVASQLILWEFIRQLRADGGCRVDIVNESPCPDRYRFLAGSERIRPWREASRSAPHDIGIMTDGGIERSGRIQAWFDECGTKMLVDHHLVGSKKTYDIELVDPEASSTCELLHSFFDVASPPLALHADLAAMFYVGLIYDTGSFQYNLTKPSTHRIAARLLETGIDFTSICERVLLECSPAARRLQGAVLSRVDYAMEGRLAWGAIGRDLFRETGTSSEDTAGIVNMILFTRGVDVAVLFYETRENLWKVSLRSRCLCNVARIARSLAPSGGGHERAAGCALEGEYGGVNRRVVESIEGILAPGNSQSPGR